MGFEHRKNAGVVLTGVLFLLACCTTAPPTIPPSPIPSRTPSAAPSAFPSITPTITATSTPPFFAEWQASGHADAQALAFRFWDTADPAQIPPDCARCHSTTCFLDFLGADGSAEGVVDTPAKIGSQIGCEACHTRAAEALRSVVMPSGVEIAGLGSNAACILCHQGRSSGISILDLVKSLAPNGVSMGLPFLSVHNGPAGAILYGSEVHAGYEYPGRAYAGRFHHAPGYDTCTGCHDPHTLHLNPQTCGECHTGADSLAGIQKSLRVSNVDYDGDGNTAEGLAGEIETFQRRLLSGITAYAERYGFSIEYRADQEPYFFDSAGEPYSSWTPLLFEAAYNYLLARMDPGAYSHNPQLLYDSIQSIGGDHIGLVRP